MATQDEFLDLVWEQINSAMQENWIENVIRESEKNPNAFLRRCRPCFETTLGLEYLRGVT